MPLPTAALDGRGSLVARDELLCEIEASLRQLGRSLGQFLGASHDLDVTLHVFMRPSAGVGDKGKLRKDEAELAEEAQHLPGDRLNIVLSADDDEARHLVADENTIVKGDGVLHAI